MATWRRARQRHYEGPQLRHLWPEAGEDVTEWANMLVRDAQFLASEREFRSALNKLLAVLDVCPGMPAALKVAAVVISLGTGNSRAANRGERLDPERLLDRRLDAVFCACEMPGCTEFWISARQLVGPGVVAVDPSPRGGRCKKCGVTLCMNHAKRTEVRYYQKGPAEFTRVECSRCGGALDSTAEPNGRRRVGT
jgi:hypothetical protein